MIWLNNLDDAKNASLQEHKPILLQFEMDGCGGCKKLNSTTYIDENLKKEMLDWFILLKLDLIRNRQERKELGAYWTPSVYFLDHNGRSFFHFNGYLPALDFRAMLRIGIAETIMPAGKYDEVIRKTEQGLNDLTDSALYPRLLVQIEKARYIMTKNNTLMKQTLSDIKSNFPNSLEAQMYFWE